MIEVALVWHLMVHRCSGLIDGAPCYWEDVDYICNRCCTPEGVAQPPGGGEYKCKQVFVFQPKGVKAP